MKIKFTPLIFFLHLHGLMRFGYIEEIQEFVHFILIENDVNPTRSSCKNGR